MSRLYHLFHKYKSRDFIYIIPLVLLSMKVQLSYFLSKLRSPKGFPTSEDSEWYLNYAYALMKDFHIGLHMNDIMYIGYNLLLTLLLAIFKNPTAVIFIQVVTTGLSVILVYQITLKLFNRLTAIIASYFYYTCWHISIWAMYILSDSFFISLILLDVYFLLLMMESDKKRYKYLFAITSLYMLVFRPTGVLSLAAMLLYILINTKRQTIYDFVKKYRFFFGGIATVAVAALIYLITGDRLDPFLASMQYNAKLVLYNVYAKGWVYDHPSKLDAPFKPDYTINIAGSLVLSFLINNWDHILVLYGKRIMAFLGWWVLNFDPRNVTGITTFIHNLLPQLTPTLLFLAGTVAAIARRGSFRKTSIIWFMFLAVFLFCILLFIDGMYRYKAPALPFICIIAAYGVDQILRTAIFILKKIAGKLPWQI